MQSKIVIGIFLLFLVITTTGCAKRFKTYNQVVEYCIEKDLPVQCGIEKCIMLSSAEFSADIRMSAENNYYKCLVSEGGT